MKNIVHMQKDMTNQEIPVSSEDFLHYFQEWEPNLC